ncbi:DUF4132 domain-containing protein [Streptomyces sp. NBC_00876]|uniref:DUF4132 domain-containing protein n=1 Tax=Streptomyces sp. NBC_00876 TaxID=2975853 RepID=UPI0038687B31|nr:DUF4132 domain-containing protein [Streptomyces sp. NBC_00876]
MRRWEYVEGSASKFWETRADGAVVTVRYGRCGSGGRTQTKEFASAGAADAHVSRTIAEKERKGYEEVAAPAPPDRSGTPSGVEPGETGEGPGALPDEDTFVLPVSWQRSLHPRRGGIARTPARAQKKTLDALAARTAEEEPWIQEFLNAPRSDPGLVEQVRHYLAGGPSPAGAAALASIVGHSSPQAGSWADRWVQLHGLPFAACAAVELFMTRTHWTQSGRRRSEPWLEALPRARYGYAQVTRRPAADRVRALLAAADDETYRAAVEALSRYRTDAHRKIIAAYLVPSETDWVTALCADPEVTAEQDPGLLSLVYCTLNSPGQAAAFAHCPSFCQSVILTATAAEGIGSAIVPMLGEELTRTFSYADTVKQIAGALVEFPTDEAFLHLLGRADTKHVRTALLEAMSRYPVRALRLLTAEVIGGADSASSTTQQLLRGHIATHRTLVEAALPALPGELADVIEPLLNPAGRIADAPGGALADVLTSPPWTRQRSTAKAIVVTGLTPVCAPAVEWLPGEREQWAATTSWYTRRQGVEDWEREVAELRHSLDESGLQPAWVYIHGPEKLVAPLLAVWDPTELWGGADTLKPVAARFGLAALPLLLRAVPRQPSALAHLLLPFVDASVARHMADWAVRLKSTKATARTWFERHGVRAAPLLVPDAVGRAGTARRAAEQALVRIAALHGDDVVLRAAGVYGAQAADAVAGLLAADPLERALPAVIPVLPGWADPALLPQITLTSGGALPEESVRHVLTMLAMSRPGEPYPGLGDVTRTVDSASSAEFAWALFEQWRLASLPAEESWAVHALGVLGDDGTVRRLTPVIRAWPGEGAHHRAVEGLDVLAAIGSDVALLHLHGISQRVKFKALKVRATEKIAEVAAALGLTGEQLSDRLVPDFGLDANGSTVIDYGTRTFTLGFDEQLRPYVRDSGGKHLKDLPKPGTRDDAELAPDERKRFMALKKGVRTVASDQVRRLEAAMVAGRSWTVREFGELFVGHPLLCHLVRRLVWLSETDGERTAFRVTRNRTFADAGGETFVLPAGAAVRLAHPLHLGEELALWSAVFADRETVQPFPQLGRAVFVPTEEEAAGHRLNRFEGTKVPTGKVLGLERRGWQRGVPQDAGVERWISKRLGDDCYLVIALNTGIAVGVVDMFPDQTLETVWLGTQPADYWQRDSYELRFGDLDAVTVSELLADLAGLTENGTS